MFNKEKESLLLLNAISGLGNRRIAKLLKLYGTAENVFNRNRAQLECDGVVPASVISNIINFPQDKFLENEYNLIAKYGVKVLVVEDEAYPSALHEIPDAPVVLYQKGDFTPLMDQSIAIVGSRRASAYGLNVANKLSFQLAQNGYSGYFRISTWY